MNFIKIKNFYFDRDKVVAFCWEPNSYDLKNETDGELLVFLSTREHCITVRGPKKLLGEFKKLMESSAKEPGQE